LEETKYKVYSREKKGRNGEIRPDTAKTKKKNLLFSLV
jgi:hypothetical protein